jgi:hypothetical protein
MKSIKILLLAICAVSVIGMSSCGDDSEEPTCKRCSAEQQIFVDGELFGTQSVSPVEYCGDDLKQLEANPIITVTQDVLGIQQEVITTYTCQ